MAVEIRVPRLGWSMEEGTLVEWLKQDGDRVEAGDLIFSLEGDKALNEVEAFDHGILRIPPDSPRLGTTIPVGTLLAYIVQPGEPVPWEKSSQMPTISPRARRVAAELGVDWAALKGSGRTGRIVERDVVAAHRSAQAARASTPTRTPVIEATPVARRVAEELDVDLQQLAARLPGRRIERADVEAAAATDQPPAPSLAQFPVQAATAGPSATRIPVGSTRRVIAERMAASAHTTAPVTLTSEVDATELVRLRQQLKADQPRGEPSATSVAQPIPSYTDLMVKIVAHALHEHPTLNSRLEGDAIVTESSIHIGIAVDTERGLMVAVIRDAGTKSLRQIAFESELLIQRVREGAATSDEMKGSTFTITNLGMYDIDAFSPIINLPECAILGTGRIAPKQVVTLREGTIDDVERVTVRHMLTLSLTFDHRVVDGAPAARFLQRLKQLVERPYIWLVN
jgi:pyruvate dehydrogenase E2 component (dihydrolipoamide acetyltransferase)